MCSSLNLRLRAAVVVAGLTGSVLGHSAAAQNTTAKPGSHSAAGTPATPPKKLAAHGLKPGDVLLAYNGKALNSKDALKVVSQGDKPVGVDVWRNGEVSRRELAPGKLGVVFDSRTAPDAIAEQRKLQKVLVAARGGDEEFTPLPGARYEVEAIARLFRAGSLPVRALFEADASEPVMDRLAASGELGRFGFIHLATHGLIDEAVPNVRR